MATKVESSYQTEITSLQSQETADVLRQRLTTAEEYTQQLMQQLEDMGFSAKLSSEPTIKGLVSSTSGKNIFIVDEENRTVNCGNEGSTHHSHLQEHADSRRQLQQNLPKLYDSFKSQSNKSSKHRAISPFSSQGMTVPSTINRHESKVSSYAPKLLSSFEVGSKRQSKSEPLEAKAGQKELEQELVRMKQLVLQLEEERQYEIDGKQKAKEETEKLRGALDEVTTARAGLEMKAEELTVAKQKLVKKLSELKEEASRESSLRSSLEESHTTLLSRLQDMESVIESLRAECRTHSVSSMNLKAEVIKLKDELSQETSKRQRTEDNYCILVTEKDRLLLHANSTQSENQHVFQELVCLQTQYADVVRQLEQMQTLVDSLATNKQMIEEERTGLQSKVQILTSDHDKLKILYEKTKESEAQLGTKITAMDEDSIKMRTEREKLMKENFEKKQKIDTLEQELKAMKQNLAQKNLEFTCTADGLELELTGIKSQLEAMETEKQQVLKDKENLLEEINQTVDTLMSERSRLQTELQGSCVETESLRLTCSRLELDKAHLLEKLEGLHWQQTTQRKVEAALSEMMKQKNELAYENGKLHSTIDQLKLELADATKEQVNVTQLRKLSESLQDKYTKSRQELSEYKIALQRLEGQTRMALEELEQKNHQMKMTQARKDDAERDLQKMLAQIEVLDGRHKHKAARYDKNMEEAKHVNKEITGTLEAVMTSHSQLQKIVESLQVELGKRDCQIGQLKAIRKKEQEEMRLEIQNYEDKMEALRQELKRERDKTGKKTVKELTEISKQNENLTSRNQDLLKANSDLRHKMIDIEKEKNEMKRRLSGQRHKLQYLHKAKKQLEDNLNKMKAVHEDIEELERMRGDYMQKNKEQGETIGSFILQVTSLQDEVRQLASAHSKAQHLLRLKEQALEKERRIRDEIRERYTECKKREEELCKRSQSSDEKLKEVHSESLEISKHLEEAHGWFVGKFDKLQAELTTSRQTQAKLEMENIDQRKSLELEKSKAQDTAERAKEMIQNSRQTINQLADYTKMADSETRKRLSNHQSNMPASI